MNNTPTNNLFDIDTWYQQPIGKKVAQLEKQQFNQLPRTLFGQSILQLGAQTHHNWLKSHNGYHLILATAHQPPAKSLYHLQCAYTELPFPPNSFDTIVLPHVLEFAAHPKIIITESWQALAPEGHLIILGFNPLSLNNFWYLFDKTKLSLPQQTKFYSYNKIYQWLKNDYYEIVYTHNFCYLPLLPQSESIIKSSAFEKFATWLLPNCGGIYLLVLKKRVIPLTPLRLRWQWREIFNDKNLTEPAAGNVHRE